MKIFRPQPRLSGQGNHKVPEASATLLFVGPGLLLGLALSLSKGGLLTMIATVVRIGLPRRFGSDPGDIPAVLDEHIRPPEDLTLSLAHPRGERP